MKLTAKNLWQMCLPANLLIVKNNFKKKLSIILYLKKNLKVSKVSEIIKTQILI